MKLLIDIPFEAYYTFKCDLEKGNSNLNALGEIIANGIPYKEQCGVSYLHQDSITTTKQ